LKLDQHPLTLFCSFVNQLTRRFFCFSSLQIILQIYASLDCEFIKYEPSTALPASFSKTFSLFTEESSGECPKLYNDADGLLNDDAFFKTAQSMIVISLICAFLAGAMVTFEFFCCRVCCAVLLEDMAYLVAIFTGGLVYLAYLNPYCDSPDEKLNDALNITGKADALDVVTNSHNELYECTFGQGSKYNVGAMLLYAVAMVVLCCSPKPTPLLRQMSK